MYPIRSFSLARYSRRKEVTHNSLTNLGRVSTSCSWESHNELCHMEEFKEKKKNTLDHAILFFVGPINSLQSIHWETL